MRGLRRAVLLLALFWPAEAWVSGSSSAERVSGPLRIALETPSVHFLGPEEEMAFHGGFRARSGDDLGWIVSRVEAALAARTPAEVAALELVDFRPDLPQVWAWAEPGEPGSLESAPPGPVRCRLHVQLRGAAVTHVPDLTMLDVEVALGARRPRAAVEALAARVEAALAEPEPLPLE